MAKYTLTPALLTAFSAILEDRAGLRFDESKGGVLQGHLRDRARARHLPGLDEYLNLLRDTVEGPAEIQRLVESVTIHETSFFRNQEHFKALTEQIISALAAAPRRGPRMRTLRVWSAGSATGEEAYSLAIACLEHPALAAWRVEILASDVSGAVLDRARAGVYTSEALRYVTPDRVRRWFTPVEAGEASGGQGAAHSAMTSRPPGARLRPGTGPILEANRTRLRFRVNDSVRRLVTFYQYNLAHTPYNRAIFGELDLLVCENVLIYFTPDTVGRVIQEFYECLNPGGYLFLGYSETLWRTSKAFTMISTPTTFYYQRPDPTPPLLFTLNRPVPPADAPAPPVNDHAAPPTLPTGTPPPTAPPIGAANRVAALPPSASVLADGVAPPPIVAQEHTERGCQLLEQGQYGPARDAFEAALRSYPAAVDALVGLAQIHANQGQPEAAITECRRALALDALCEEAHLLLALIYRQQQQWASALDHFAKAIYINNESVAGHYHLAELHRAQGNGTAAAREYRRTLWALDRTHTGDTISGLPVAMIRKACEQQLGRLHDQGTDRTPQRPESIRRR